MKTRFLLSLACAAGLAAAVPASLHARGDDAARNAVIGGIAGAIIGENNDHHAAEGAVIGVAAGLLLTALTDDSDRDRGYYEPAPACRETVVVSRPYYPPHHRVVVVPPPCPPRRVVVVAPTYAGWYRGHDNRWYRYDNHRDHRDYRHDRRDSRRDNRWDDRDDRRDDRHNDRRDRR